MTSEGGAWVFTRTGSTWTQQGKKIEPSANKGESEFGSAVALSGDGNTALIGGQFDHEGTGAAWVFTRSAGKWTQQGAKLTGAGENGAGWFGRTAALSADGNTALIGAPFDHPAESKALSDWVGAAWVFTRSGTTWTEQGPKLTGAPEEVGDGEFAGQVALSGNGNTALIGGAADNSHEGAVWVLRREGAGWRQAGTKLTDTEPSGNPYFGQSLALAGEADVALIAAPGENAVWTFAPGEAAPDAGTGAASSLTPISATLNGTVIPNGAEVETCRFEYGPTAAYGSSVPCSTAPGSGEYPLEVSASIAGLEAGTTYDYRLVASNSQGTGRGIDETFKTVPTGLEPVTSPKGGARSTNTRSPGV